MDVLLGGGRAVLRFLDILLGSDWFWIAVGFCLLINTIVKGNVILYNIRESLEKLSDKIERIEEKIDLHSNNIKLVLDDLKTDEHKIKELIKMGFPEDIAGEEVLGLNKK